MSGLQAGVANGAGSVAQDARPSIPLVDLSGLEADADNEAALQAGKALVEAFRTAGFAYVKNHGIPDEVVVAAFAWRGYSGIGWEKVTQMLFDADEISERRKIPDLKESYETGREDDDHLPNIWIPEASLPGFRAFFNGFYETCYGLELRLLRGVALGMGLDNDPDFFQRRHVKKNNQIRLLHYPPVEERLLRAGEAERLGAHTDFGTMTLLFQDDVGGLEVEDPGEPRHFTPVPPVPGTVVVNIGDFLQRWSNDTLRSTMHRVRAPPLEASGDGDGLVTRARYSIPYFIGADQEETVDCVPGCFGPGRPKKYDPINSREYIEMRLNATY
ncbi:hypothetical protein CPLU01_14550 [Colletotrichum plurivorum]|uniref:Fe2OG dioxygenase domain-containing protein n=1 Tax=Colletotrichum plurivorum TaxID=2175906 RepID=A0A8H6JJQ2_9PEZI|nr:hypothetical protein CPLU01_14550 [Colletotrichum plurivorum]